MKNCSGREALISPGLFYCSTHVEESSVLAYVRVYFVYM